MAGDTIITIIGNLTADPEMRFTPSGAAVASFTVASTPRTFDRQAGEWKDGETLFMRCSIWRDAAENVAGGGIVQGQSGYNAPVGGAADDPWATGGSTSFGDEPPF